MGEDTEVNDEQMGEYKEDDEFLINFKITV